MEKIYKIDGMMCVHCVAHVKSALEAIDGVSHAEVSLEKEEAKIFFEKDVADDIIKQAIKDAGYQIKD